MPGTQGLLKNPSNANIYAIGYKAESLSRWALIMELHFGMGVSFTKLINDYNIPRTTVSRALKAYRPIKSDRNITITISSKV